MKNILLIMAMEQEANPIIKALNLNNIESSAFFPRFQGQYKGLNVIVSLNGKPTGQAIERIGTEFATLNTDHSIREFQPDVVINAGTCGSFSPQSQIGDIYTTNKPVVFLDHRFSHSEYKKFGEGHHPSYYNEAFFKGVDYKLGVITTGSSPDMSGLDKKIIRKFQGTCKEMEAAAIAQVCALYETPYIGIKSVTDFLDLKESTSDQFVANIALASNNLKKAVVTVFENISKTYGHNPQNKVA